MLKYQPYAPQKYIKHSSQRLPTSEQFTGDMEFAVRAVRLAA